MPLGHIASMSIKRAKEQLRLAMQPRLIREGGWILLGQVGSVAGNLVALKALTQVLPPNIYGEVNLITVAMILPSWILFAPFAQASIRMYSPSRERGLLPSMLSTCVMAHAVSSVLVSAVATSLILSGPLDFVGLPRLVGGLAVLVFLVEMWQGFGLGIYGAARRRAEVAILTSLAVWLRPFFALVMVWRFGASVPSVLGGYLVGGLLILPLALRSIWRDIRISPGKGFQAGILKEMIVYGGPFAIWSILAWSHSYVERYILEWIMGGGVVGPYVAAVQVTGLPFLQASGFLAAFIGPIAYERAGAASDTGRLESARTLIHQGLVLFAVAGVLIVSLYWVAGEWLMSILTHSSYVMPAGVLTILAVGGLAWSAAQLLAVQVFAYNRPILLIWAHAVPALLSLPLSWILVLMRGVEGAAIAKAATSLVHLAVLLGLTRGMLSADWKLVPVPHSSGDVSGPLFSSRERG